MIRNVRQSWSGAVRFVAAFGIGACLLAVVATSFAGEKAAGKPIEFTQTFSGKPLDVTPPAGETATDASKHFLAAAENLYVGDAKAISKGSELFLKNCAVCHGIKANGRMGPSLIDEQFVYEKNDTDKGVFETVYGGAAGLMAPLKGRMTQDEILKVMAYLTSLKTK